MHLYTPQQIRDWDSFTIKQEPIASIDLMERAATACVDWLALHCPTSLPFYVVCGKGANGGDGLAIARLLQQKGLRVEVFILEMGHLGSADFETNLQRLHDVAVPTHFVQGEQSFPQLKDVIVIDALFGTGINRPLDGLAASLVQHINEAKQIVISIDVPSGLLLEASSKGSAVIKATHTLTFEIIKWAFLLPESEPFVGQFSVLPIKLHPAFNAAAPFRWMEANFIRSLLKPRSSSGHKGTYGHALIVGGAKGKIGAPLLSTRACMRTGAGLTTAFVPNCGYSILQTAAPEAMTLTDKEDFITEIKIDAEKFNAIGLGPGMGIAPETIAAVSRFIKESSGPLVIDADGLNCIAKKPELLTALPNRTIITPHPKEFERLFGPSSDDFERLNKALTAARRMQIIIVLKGHHTLIASPDGPSYFNSTGNAGMATGGTGDVLTGIITSLLAQGFEPLHAAQIGVYLHGLAGDLAAQKLSQEALIAGDVIEYIGEAYKSLWGN